MSLSSSTILLFAFLIPAIIFRFTVYSNSIVKRPLGSGNLIHITVSILTLSVLIQIISFFVFWLLSSLASSGLEYTYKISITEFDEKIYIFYNNTKFTITKFIFEHYLISLAYLVVLLGISSLLGLLFTFAAKRYVPVGRLLFGQLAQILSGQVFPVLPCFILTKICHENKRIVYSGFVAEVALRDGSNIDHIVLQNSEKFYFKINQRSVETTFFKSQSLSRDTNSYGGLLYVSGDEIENIHFDQYYLDATNFGYYE